MHLKAYWAYDFTCEKPIEEILSALNEAGPWTWQLRDSYYYGDYLNTRPIEGLRVRIHELPGPWSAPSSPRHYSALLEIEPNSAAERTVIDAVLHDLLTRINARNVVAIEPYD